MPIGYPNLDRPFLEFHNGRFSEAFLAFNPFFTLPESFNSIADATASRRLWKSHEIYAEPVISGLSSKHVYGGNSLYPNIETIIKHGKPVSWDVVISECGFATRAELCLALLTSVGALNAKYARPDLKSRMQTCCERKGFYWPKEGDLSPIIFAPLTRIFRTYGFEEIVVEDEHGGARERGFRCRLLPLTIF